MTANLLPLAEAQARLLALGVPVEPEMLPLKEAGGRWASADVVALRSQPARDLSAMDGYAIHFADLPGPWRMIGESAAGAAFESVISAGETVRIFTGAAMPRGADTVLIQEEAARAGDTVSLTGEGPPGAGSHVRRSGNDFGEGDTLIRSGDALTPARIGLAAAAGHARIAARRRVTVALLSTGNELAPPSATLRSDQIPASNGPMLRAMLARLPVTLDDLGIVGDNEGALLAALIDAGHADIIVTIGGASVGDHDLVRPALARAGAALDFWRIAVKPGKPLLAAKFGAAIVLGLPGNPASAFVTARLLLEPLIAHLGGARDPGPRFISARLAQPLPANGARAEFLRGRWRGGAVEPLREQASGSLAALAEAEVLIHRPIGVAAARASDMAEVLLLA